MANQGGVGNWNVDDTLMLRQAMIIFPPETNHRFLRVSEMFPEARRNITLLQHYLEELPGDFEHFVPPQNHGAWSNDEDRLLFMGLTFYGRKWTRISRELVLTRNASQCRGRYRTNGYAGMDF